MALDNVAWVYHEFLYTAAKTVAPIFSLYSGCVFTIPHSTAIRPRVNTCPNRFSASDIEEKAGNFLTDVLIRNWNT